MRIEGESPDLPWTGERLVPAVKGDVALEHLHRYALACRLAPGRSTAATRCRR